MNVTAYEKHGPQFYFETVLLASLIEQPLRDRQAVAAARRERFRCGGCGGPATRIDPIDGGLPLCGTCTPDDAIPLECGWSDAHVAARPPEPPAPPPSSALPVLGRRAAPPSPPATWFAFTIDRDIWLRGRHLGILEDGRGHRCASAFFLCARAEQDPDKSYPAGPGKPLENAYKKAPFLVDVADLNDDPKITDAERETRIRDLFAARGITVTFIGGAS